MHGALCMGKYNVRTAIRGAETPSRCRKYTPRKKLHVMRGNIQGISLNNASASVLPPLNKNAALPVTQTAEWIIQVQAAKRALKKGGGLKKRGRG